MPKQKSAFEYASDKERDHFGHLDDLRASGVTNMYGGAVYLRSAFPDLSKTESHEVLIKWIKTFEDRGCPGRDDQ